MELKVAINTSNYPLLNASSLCNSANIKHLLQQKLFAVMGLPGMGIATADLPGDVELTPETIPLHRLSDDTCVIYRCAIALQLSPLLQLPASDIANQLVACFPTISQYTAGQIYLEFSVEVVFPGWIHFRVSQQSLATWLQQLIQIPYLQSNRLDFSSLEVQTRGGVGDEIFYNEGKKLDNNSSDGFDIAHQAQLDDSLKDLPNLFPVQYAHARCCSLLRLAHRQGLIQLSDLDFNTPIAQLAQPNPIPWLNDDQGAHTGQIHLRLVHPAERCLISQMLDVSDITSHQGQLSCLKLAIALGNAFESFYSRCRIWGEVKTQAPKLAQARLGLVAITQGLLRSLLQEKLGVPAPVEL
jgi:arginyl-tRNA synthetase